MNRIMFILTLLAVIVLMVGCTGDAERERLRATVNVAVQQTQTLVASWFTPTPTLTPIPSETPDIGELIPNQFAISFPFDWETYDFSGQGIHIATAMYHQAYQENQAMPCYASEGTGVQSLGRSLRLVATGPTASADHCVYAYILWSAPVDDMTLEEFTLQKVADLPETLPAGTEIEHKILNLNYVPAAEIIYEQPIVGKDELETIIHYMILGKEGTFLVTFVTPSEEFKANYSAFTLIVQSFRLTAE